MGLRNNKMYNRYLLFCDCNTYYCMYPILHSLVYTPLLVRSHQLDIWHTHHQSNSRNTAMEDLTLNKKIKHNPVRSDQDRILRTCGTVGGTKMFLYFYAKVNFSIRENYMYEDNFQISKISKSTPGMLCLYRIIPIKRPGHLYM